MNYTLNQLRIFLKISELGSVTKASEALQLTQPAVSIQLKNFQDQFDIPLTEIIGRRIYLTAFGKEVALAAEGILQQVENIRQMKLAYKGLLVGKLRISIVSTGKYVLPYFLSDFLQAYPGVELVVDVTNKSRVIKSLESNDVDLALVSILPGTIQIEKLDLLQNKMYLVGSEVPDIKKGASLQELFGTLPLIFREVGSGTRQMMEGFIQKNHLPVVKKMELASNEAVKQALLAGLGYSIMPLIGLRNEIQNQQLKIIPARGLPIKTMWRLIWLKGKNHIPVSRALIQYLSDNREKIVLDKFSWYEDF